MGLVDELKQLLGIRSVNVGDLNKKAVVQQPASRPTGNEIKKQAPASRKQAPIEVIPEYQAVVSLIEKGESLIFVSGKAGSGKTTLIRYLREQLEKKKNIVTVAPTGVAALNVGGVTIHSFFRLPPKVLLDEDVVLAQNRKIYKALDLLIVDEISMTRVDAVDAMDKFLRLNGKDSDKPFGGTQVLFVGDLFQLPPVVTREEIFALRGWDSPFFFSAKVLSNMNMISLELNKVFRQTDEDFIDILNQIRVAENLESLVPLLNTACSIEKDSFLTLTATNKVADSINDRELRSLPGAKCTFRGRTTGNFATRDRNLPSPMELDLKPGARVMFTKNGMTWVNGTMGVVKDIGENSVRVELLTDNPGMTFDVTPATWESYGYEYDEDEEKIVSKKNGSYTQIPLMLAWAVTIHKGQGKTLESVKIDLGTGAFASGQVYVALSRCGSLKDITLARPLRERDIKCDPTIVRFFQAMLSTPKTS